MEITVAIGQGRDGGGQPRAEVESAREMTANITSLPYELLLAIVWSNRLDQDDVQALRLSCRTLDAPAASRLFFRIYISKLITDRDTFLAICNSPHLAQHVREVEWLEISHAVGDFLNKFPHTEEWTLADELANLYRCMETTSQTLFWLFNTTTDRHRVDYDADAIAAVRRNTVAVFRPVFEAAIDKLTNLHTFVSRPMTSERVLSDLGYPITAWQFQSFQETVQRNSEGTIQRIPETNDGLFLFLLPAMSRPTSAVTRLRWFDEFPGFSVLRPFPDSAFRGLESLEMSVRQWTQVYPQDFDAVAGLRNALRGAAPTLRHLKVSMDDVMDFKERPSNAYLGGMIVVWLCRYGFALRSLSLCSMGLLPNMLPRLIRANATSLRHLTVQNTPISPRLVRDMARIEGLDLESIQIIRDEEVVYGEGSWWSFDGEADEVATLQDEELSNDGTPTTAGNGLSLRKEVVTESALLRYLRGEAPTNDHDRQAYQVVDGVSDDIPVLISTLPRTEPTMEGDDDECASETDSVDSDSVEYRRRTAPKWGWARYFHIAGSENEGRIFAFPLPNAAIHGHKTERWRFTSRDGDVAYGDDPWEWFEDWDPEAGDLEEPLPYCKALRKFVEMDNRLKGADLGEYLGEKSEAWKLVKHLSPPEGAIEYDLDEDLASKPSVRWFDEYNVT